MPLLPEDQRHLTAAQGYVELGMHLDANAALDEIDADLRNVPEVLAVRLRVCQALENWELMRIVAGKLAAYDPDSIPWVVALAFATRRAKSIEAARPILLAAVEQHPNAAILHYNLACYDCADGQVRVAKARLSHALKLDQKLHIRALEDADLEPLWDSLGDAGA